MADYREATTKLLGAVSHPCQTKVSIVRAEGTGRVKPTAIVSNAQNNQAVLKSEVERNVTGCRVFDSVGHCLLRDPQEIVLDIRRQAFGGTIELEVDRNIGARGCLVCNLPESGNQVACLQGLGPQVPDRTAGFGQAVADQLVSEIEVPPGRLR